VAADACASAYLAHVSSAVMLAYCRAAALLAVALDAVVVADAGAPAYLANASHAVMLAYRRAVALLAGSRDAVMVADAGAPAYLAFAPLAVMLDRRAATLLAPALVAVMVADACAPHILQSLLMRLCSHIAAELTHSLQSFLRWLWSRQMPEPPHTLHWLLWRLCSHIAEPTVGHTPCSFSGLVVVADAGASALFALILGGHRQTHKSTCAQEKVA
jgi:hypothetical protein